MHTQIYPRFSENPPGRPYAAEKDDVFGETRTYSNPNRATYAWFLVPCVWLIYTYCNTVTYLFLTVLTTVVSNMVEFWIDKRMRNRTKVIQH